jgi:putative SOS response-associated peptidase YedK
MDQSFRCLKHIHGLVAARQAGIADRAPHERRSKVRKKALRTKDFEQWEHGVVKDAAAPMKPAGEDAFQMWPVSKRVNNSRAPDDDATLIERITSTQ